MAGRATRLKARHFSPPIRRVEHRGLKRGGKKFKSCCLEQVRTDLCRARSVSSIRRVEHRGLRRGDKNPSLVASSKCEPIYAVFGLVASSKRDRSVPCLFSQCPLRDCFVPSGKSTPPLEQNWTPREQARIDLCPANSRDASAPRQSGQCDCLVSP